MTITLFLSAGLLTILAQDVHETNPSGETRGRKVRTFGLHV